MFEWIGNFCGILNDVVISGKSLTGQMRYRAEKWAEMDKAHLDKLAKQAEEEEA